MTGVEVAMITAVKATATTVLFRLLRCQPLTPSVGRLRSKPTEKNARRSSNKTNDGAGEKANAKDAADSGNRWQRRNFKAPDV